MQAQVHDFRRCIGCTIDQKPNNKQAATVYHCHQKQCIIADVSHVELQYDTASNNQVHPFKLYTMTDADMLLLLDQNLLQR